MPALTRLVPVVTQKELEVARLVPAATQKELVPAATQKDFGVASIVPPSASVLPGAGLDNVFIGPAGSGPDMTGWTDSETEHYNFTDCMPKWRPGLVEANYVNCRPMS